jgi:hypothetical protein
MAWFRKKHDPLSDRESTLSDEITQLENEIKKLDSRLKRNGSHPKLRSTAIPHGATVTHQTEEEPPSPRPQRAQEPIFEEVDVERIKDRSDVEVSSTPEHYNDLGVRKYDLPALVRRIRNHFRGPSTTNPKLVSYLAAGGIQGLRPMRYERRVARNRFIALVVVLFFTLLGLIAVFFGRR